MFRWTISKENSGVDLSDWRRDYLDGKTAAEWCRWSAVLNELFC